MCQVLFIPPTLHTQRKHAQHFLNCIVLYPSTYVISSPLNTLSWYLYSEEKHIYSKLLFSGDINSPIVYLASPSPV